MEIMQGDLCSAFNDNSLNVFSDETPSEVDPLNSLDDEHLYRKGSGANASSGTPINLERCAIEIGNFDIQQGDDSIDEDDNVPCNLFDCNSKVIPESFIKSSTITKISDSDHSTLVRGSSEILKFRNISESGSEKSDFVISESPGESAQSKQTRLKGQSGLNPGGIQIKNLLPNGSGNTLGTKSDSGYVECIALSKWREEHTLEIQKREKKELLELEELRLQAQKDIEEFYHSRMMRIEEKKKRNRFLQSDLDAEKVDSRSYESLDENSWREIVNLLDFNKSLHKRDTSRFKEILISLSTAQTPCE